MSSSIAQKLKAVKSSWPAKQFKRLVRPLSRPGGRIPVGAVRWGDFRGSEPICRNFGYSRGSPVDRHFIESFLGEHAQDIRGRVLEIKDSGYTRRFGGSRVNQSDVLDIDAANSAATIIADLNDPDALEANAYDCAIVTQTLQYLFEPANALANLHRCLKPGGTLLLTVPGITPMRECGAVWYWSFTSSAIERLLSETFERSSIKVHSYGNLQSATAFLHGLSATELRETERNRQDPAYQMLVVARAVKGSK